MGNFNLGNVLGYEKKIANQKTCYQTSSTQETYKSVYFKEWFPVPGKSIWKKKQLLTQVFELFLMARKKKLFFQRCWIGRMKFVIEKVWNLFLWYWCGSWKPFLKQTYIIIYLCIYTTRISSLVEQLDLRGYRLFHMPITPTFRHSTMLSELNKTNSHARTRSGMDELLEALLTIYWS